MSVIRHIMATVLCLFLAAPVMAEDYPELRASVARINPQLQVLSIETTPMFAMYKVVISTGDTLYMSADGDFFFTGTMYQNRDGGGLVNLTEIEQQSARAKLMRTSAAEQAWVFPAHGETKKSITIFTDVDCFYCQKLHAEIDDINALGIEVRYLGFPRAGLGSSSHQVLSDAWCAEDQNAFLTEAKLRSHNKMPPQASPPSCDNPVAVHYELSQQMALSGTPAIVLDTGELWPGYIPAAEMAKRLGIN